MRLSAPKRVATQILLQCTLKGLRTELQLIDIGLHDFPEHWRFPERKTALESALENVFGRVSQFMFVVRLAFETEFRDLNGFGPLACKHPYKPMPRSTSPALV